MPITSSGFYNLFYGYSQGALLVYNFTHPYTLVTGGLQSFFLTKNSNDSFYNILLLMCFPLFLLLALF